MKLQIKSQEVVTQTGKVKATGRPYSMRKQNAYWATGDEVRRVEILLADDQSPYAPGTYELDDSSFIVDQYNNLQFAYRLTLVPFGSARRVA